MHAEFNRNRPPFGDLFGVSADKLIQEMDDSAADIANQRPRYEAELTTVGMQRSHIPVLVIDPLDSTQKHQLACTVKISVSLAAMRRGIHVSRMSNALAEVATSRTFDHLLAFTTALAEAIAASQGASACRVRAEGVYSFLERVAGWKPAKNKLSMETMPLIAETVLDGDRKPEKSAGIRVSHMTACPCVQSALRTLLRVKGVEHRDAPLFTHSQRCETQVTLVRLKDCFDFAAALRVADRCMTRTQNTLPREHELALVHGSHSTPSFLEDVVRMCGREFYDAFAGQMEPAGFVHVSSVSQESIHCFDLHAEARFPVDLQPRG